VIILRSIQAKLVCGLVAVHLSAVLPADEVLVSFRFLAPDVALEMARAALQSCRDEGYQVSVAVVDRMGITQVMLRDRFAGAHTPDAAERMAATAVSFREDTQSIAENTAPDSPQSGARFIEGTLMLGGGIPVRASGSIVAGIGVSGGPTGAANHACAQAGISAVREKLELES
jgi:uncharacterized protein GlcG (DUF336 family)